MHLQLITRLDYIENDIQELMNLTKHSVILRDFHNSITTLHSYLDELANLDRAIKRSTDTWQMQNKSFVEKVTKNIDVLKTSIDIAEKRKSIIEKIANTMVKNNKRGAATYYKKMPKCMNETKKIAIGGMTIPEPHDVTTVPIAVLVKEKANMEKQLAKERETMEKQLAKEKAKMEKQLAKEKAKMEKQLAKEKANMEKQQAKLLAKEKSCGKS